VAALRRPHRPGPAPTLDGSPLAHHAGCAARGAARPEWRIWRRLGAASAPVLYPDAGRVGAVGARDAASSPGQGGAQARIDPGSAGARGVGG